MLLDRAAEDVEGTCGLCAWYAAFELATGFDEFGGVLVVVVSGMEVCLRWLVLTVMQVSAAPGVEYISDCFLCSSIVTVHAPAKPPAKMVVKIEGELFLSMLKMEL